MKQYTPLCRTQESRADLIAGFQLPDRRRAAALFLEAFAGEAAAAERFARAVTDELGHGLVSPSFFEPQRQSFNAITMMWGCVCIRAQRT